MLFLYDILFVCVVLIYLRVDMVWWHCLALDADWWT